METLFDEGDILSVIQIDGNLHIDIFRHPNDRLG